MIAAGQSVFACHLMMVESKMCFPSGFECQGGDKRTQSWFQVLRLSDHVLQCRCDALHLPPWLYRAPWTEDICRKLLLERIPWLFMKRETFLSEVSFVVLLWWQQHKHTTQTYVCVVFSVHKWSIQERRLEEGSWSENILQQTKW